MELLSALNPSFKSNLIIIKDVCGDVLVTLLSIVHQIAGSLFPNGTPLVVILYILKAQWYVVGILHPIVLFFGRTFEQSNDRPLIAIHSTDHSCRTLLMSRRNLIYLEYSTDLIPWACSSDCTNIFPVILHFKKVFNKHHRNTYDTHR